VVGSCDVHATCHWPRVSRSGRVLWRWPQTCTGSGSAGLAAARMRRCRPRSAGAAPATPGCGRGAMGPPRAQWAPTETHWRVTTVTRGADELSLTLVLGAGWGWRAGPGRHGRLWAAVSRPKQSGAMCCVRPQPARVPADRLGCWRQVFWCPGGSSGSGGGAALELDRRAGGRQGCL
jgi:hypothetical protein